MTLVFLLPRQSLYIDLFHSLSPSDRLIFRNSLFGAGILEKKNEYVSQLTYACVNVHNPRTISWIAAFGQY